jgi:membrane-bound lytic murein transglycosylase F
MILERLVKGYVLRPNKIRFRLFSGHRLRRMTILAAIGLLAACGTPESHLERVLHRGELRVATRSGPTTYYLGGEEPKGLEYDLAKGFAERLGVQLSVIVADDMDQLFELLDAGEVDLIAAGISATANRARRWQFSAPYQEISVKLVFRQGEFWPRDFSQLDGRLTILARSSHSELLVASKPDSPLLSWHEVTDANVEDLVESVLAGDLAYTLVDSNDLALQRRYHPDLAVAFTVQEQQPLAWVFRKQDDPSLVQAANEYFQSMQDQGDLTQLLDLYYGHVDRFDYVGTKAFLAAARERLPQFRPLFEDAAAVTGLDWRLLAAVSYQESHWNPRAKSPTGVRGMMMLTLPTAERFDVENRLNPTQSIRAGASYLTQLKQRLPERIAEPDRTWLALAAYNVGLGHLEDARILTEFQGGNPDRWSDVKERLPLLSQKRYYKFLKYGYARGHEPVQYVDNIRRYLDILQWLEPAESPLTNDDAPELDKSELPAKS